MGFNSLNRSNSLHRIAQTSYFKICTCIICNASVALYEKLIFLMTATILHFKGLPLGSCCRCRPWADSKSWKNLVNHFEKSQQVWAVLLCNLWLFSQFSINHEYCKQISFLRKQCLIQIPLRKLIMGGFLACKQSIMYPSIFLNSTSFIWFSINIFSINCAKLKQKIKKFITLNLHPRNPFLKHCMHRIGFLKEYASCSGPHPFCTCGQL